MSVSSTEVRWQRAALTVRRLESGYWLLRGTGPNNWAQPPHWPCGEATLRAHAFSHAGEAFVRACMAAADAEAVGKVSRMLRVYEPAEIGRHGYPRAWYRCTTCIDDDDDADCNTCLGAGSIKNLVRHLAGGRCERCWHPYSPGQHGNGEWSACDVACRHRGPLRVGDLEVEDSPPALWLDDGRPVEARWRILTVHHLTGDKADCRWWNLAALCQRCHLEIQGRVNMAQVWPHEHSDWMRPHAAGYYAWTHLGEELGRDEAIARLDELLALEAVGR